MATQPVEVIEADEPQTPRDFEAEARRQGWKPLEEFKGDPEKWTDAETFAKRADDNLPMLQKTTQAQARKLERMERDLKFALGQLQTAERRSYEKAKADLEQRQDEAAEVGDLASVRKARDDLKKLNEDVATQAAPIATPREAEEAVIEWREANPWYDSDPVARDYANLVAADNVDLAKTMRPAEFYEMVAEKVKTRFGARLEVADDDDPKPARKKVSAVEGATPRKGPRGSRTFSDLPVEAQRMADRFVERGYLKSRDDYVKTYQWDS